MKCLAWLCITIVTDQEYLNSYTYNDVSSDERCSLILFIAKCYVHTTKDRTLSQVLSNAQRVEVEQSCRYTRQAPLVLSRFSVQSIYRKLGVHEYMPN
jgi:hypothetical protein